MKNLILSIFAASLLASCTTLATSKSKVGTQQATIASSSWTLADNVKGRMPTLVLENGKVSGNAGCNNYFGTLSLDATAGNFAVSNVGSTRMACDNLGTENRFLTTLEQANKYVVTGNTLELYRDNLLLLKFNRQ